MIEGMCVGILAFKLSPGNVEASSLYRGFRKASRLRNSVLPVRTSIRWDWAGVSGVRPWARRSGHSVCPCGGCVPAICPQSGATLCFGLCSPQPPSICRVLTFAVDFFVPQQKHSEEEHYSLVSPPIFVHLHLIPSVTEIHGCGPCHTQTTAHLLP